MGTVGQSDKVLLGLFGRTGQQLHDEFKAAGIQALDIPEVTVEDRDDGLEMALVLSVRVAADGSSYDTWLDDHNSAITTVISETSEGEGEVEASLGYGPAQNSFYLSLDYGEPSDADLPVLIACGLLEESDI